MTKSKTVLRRLSVIILIIAVLIAAFILIFFTIPARGYDPAKYRLFTACDDPDCTCGIY